MSNTEPKKRGRKPKLTKQQHLEQLDNDIQCLKQVVEELREDEKRIASLSLKRVPELLQETFKNLEEDIEELENGYKELSSQPELLQQN
jgi:septation ring formation regulator EzrA